MDASSAEFVRSRASGICEYCHVSQSYFAQLFHIEHIVAKQHRGSDNLGNLALCCPRCNLHKGPNLAGHDPETGEMVRLFNPRKDEWHRHFLESPDGLVIGTTPEGRVTAYVLNMNAENRVALRKAIRRLELG